MKLDSRKVEKGDLFIAVKGSQIDGHAFIENAIEKGASAIVCNNDAFTSEEVTVINVKDSSFALGKIAANFYDNPSAQLKLVGVTGTNGKSTIVSLLNQMFNLLGHKSGLISTIYYDLGGEQMPSTHTTPNAIILNKLLRKMVDNGCEYCFAEVSSHAIHQNRIYGIEFAGGLFSNITLDHLDYHKTFKEYINVKKAFFDNLGNGAFALVNTDDKHGKIMLQNTKAEKHTFGIKSMADFNLRIIENNITGLILNVKGNEVYSRLVGEYNASNLLAVYAVSQLLGIDHLNALEKLSLLKPVKGRFEIVSNKDNTITGIVDYAHSPDALEKILTTIVKVKKKNNRLITLVGCGGDRDRSKRPIMAKIAIVNSDLAILTSDNPRTENPKAILDEMSKGLDLNLGKFLKITDRREAINTAVMMAKSGDIILVAGKGHEDYQDVNGVKHPFDDKTVLKEAFEINAIKF